MFKIRWVFALLLIVIILNIGVLYGLFFEFRSETRKIISQQSGLDVSSDNNLEEISSTPTISLDSLTCPKACTDEINNLKRTVARITPKVIKEVEKVVEKEKSTPSTTKEYSIFLGGGSTKSDSWEDISGLKAYINSNNYAEIQSVVFEVSLRIPTKNGRVYARLFNKTDGQAILTSEVSTDSDKGTFLQSQNIALGQGNNLYQVQMKTSMKYESLLDFARVKIITK